MHCKLYVSNIGSSYNAVLVARLTEAVFKHPSWGNSSFYATIAYVEPTKEETKTAHNSKTVTFLTRLAWHTTRQPPSLTTTLHDPSRHHSLQKYTQILAATSSEATINVILQSCCKCCAPLISAMHSLSYKPFFTHGFTRKNSPKTCQHLSKVRHCHCREIT